MREFRADPSRAAEAIADFLRAVRERHGLKRSVVAAALDMGEQNIRYYESGRNRLAAEDITRFAEAYRMDTGEREQLARMLGLLADEDARSLSDDEQAELDRYLSDPDVRTEFATTAKSMMDWTDQEKRSVLDVVRTMREMIDRRRENQ